MNLAFNHLSVSQLMALAAILEVRNLSRAARLLGTSQPALSRHLAQFREALGDPLMVRRGREYVLTERGQALLDPLRDVLAGLERLSSPAEFSLRAASGVFAWQVPIMSRNTSCPACCMTWPCRRPASAWSSASGRPTAMTGLRTAKSIW